jgi:RHS repeat-associated protein
VVLLSSASGSILEAYRYGVWGDVRVFNAAGGQLITAPKSRFLFTGRDYDAEMGLYHSRTRAYSPKLGRFMQIDSVDFSGDDLNLYRYCMNNPLNYRDPFGTNPFKDLMDKIKKWCGVGQNGEQFEKDMKDLGESVDNYNETAADSYDKFMDPNITPEEFNQAVDDVKDAARDVSGRAGDAAGSGSKIPGQISGGKTP